MRRFVRIAALVAALGLAAPVPVILALRWVDPPLTAFMLHSHWRDDAQGPTVYYHWVDLPDIAPALPLAAVAAEDQTFPRHNGFVWEQIDKALAENARGGGLRGASSITQQTAKNLFLWPTKSYVRKAIEAYLTVWIELLWPKRRILEVYLNIAQFDTHVFGAGAAAHRLFDTTADRLSAPQAALLAAVLPAPERSSATRPSDYTRQRQQWILRQMEQLGAGYLAPILEPG